MARQKKDNKDDIKQINDNIQENKEQDNMEQVKEKDSIQEQFNKQTKEENISKQIKKIDNDELIKVMNYTAGKLVYVNPRTQQQWLFEGYGATDHMPFVELQTMKSTYPKFLFEPWLVIMNDDAVDLLGLRKFYETILQPKEIDRFYKMNEFEMEEFLNNAPKNMKQLIIDITREKIKNKSFGDLFKIKHIESVLNCKLLD